MVIPSVFMQQLHFFVLNLSSGHSHVGLFLTSEEQKRVCDVTCMNATRARYVHGVADEVKMATFVAVFSSFRMSDLFTGTRHKPTGENAVSVFFYSIPIIRTYDACLLGVSFKCYTHQLKAFFRLEKLKLKPLPLGIQGQCLGALPLTTVRGLISDGQSLRKDCNLCVHHLCTSV